MARMIERRGSAERRRAVGRGAATAVAAALIAALLPVAIAGGARAGEPDDGVRVERAESERPETLRFLGENREFFRARLDLLRVTLGPRHGSASEIDPRYLRWQEMLAANETARDSTALGEEWIRRRELMQSVEDLLALEETMDGMESMLDAQAGRLARLEEDFTGAQSTALVVLLTGVPTSPPPTEISLVDPDGEDWIVDLDADTRLALERGGTVELLHRLVEPRPHRLEVRLAGDGWDDAGPFALAVEPTRDRMTFVELDLARLAAAGEGAFPSRAWVR
jgi:hypothetical protein